MSGPLADPRALTALAVPAALEVLEGQEGVAGTPDSLRRLFETPLLQNDQPEGASLITRTSRPESLNQTTLFQCRDWNSRGAQTKNVRSPGRKRAKRKHHEHHEQDAQTKNVRPL